MNDANDLFPVWAVQVDAPVTAPLPHRPEPDPVAGPSVSHLFRGDDAPSDEFAPRLRRFDDRG